MYVHVHIHTIKFVFYYISYVKFLRTVIDRKENQIDLKNQKPWPLDARRRKNRKKKRIESWFISEIARGRGKVETTAKSL